jgi:hypothetical protein
MFGMPQAASQATCIVAPQLGFLQMGLLDDAIRDHIDLLRRRGADPTEIAKAESEALGPVVREVEEPEAHEDTDDLVAGTQPVPAAEADEFEEEEAEGIPFEDDEPFDAESELEEELPVAAEAQSAPVDQATEHFDVFTEEDVDTEAEVASEEEDLEDPSLRSVDTAAAPEVAEEREGDILEGTPDFLEESPDHDRLWFEQAPPKDFDFEDDK